MRCPYCSCEETQVKDSRPTEENAAIRRRRVCPDCGGRFTTFERVQLREITVIKSNGARELFDAVGRGAVRVRIGGSYALSGRRAGASRPRGAPDHRLDGAAALSVGAGGGRRRVKSAP